MFFKMSFHSFVPAEPVEDIFEPDPVEVTILTDEPLGLLFNGVALGAEDTIRLPIVDAPLSIRTGKCRYRLTLDGDEMEGEGFFFKQDEGVELNANECELEMNDGRDVTVKITDLEFSSAGVTMICTALRDIEAAAEPASEDPDVDGETDSSE